MLNNREIGSEFWLETYPKEHIAERDGVYALSGRTAIDLIIQDILQKKAVKNVAMPAWCCESMVAPFVDYKIDVVFYQGNDVPNADIFYFTNYFGYENTLDLGTISNAKNQGSIILYDRTHSFMMDDKSYENISNYSFTSIRKWMGVVTGAVINGLSTTTLKDCPYIKEKERAMLDKYRYLNGDNSIRKESFLSAFGEFGHHLTEDYKNYRMDDLSYTIYKQADLNTIKQQRKENAAFIHKNLNGVQIMFSLTDNSVPLFVPVLFDSKEQRDFVRKKLIERQIYCPIHWPQPNNIPASFKVNDIVNRELSLICDQRYGLEEMKRLIKIIHQNI